MKEKPKLQKKDFLMLIDSLDKFGDVIVEIGTVEKKIGSFDKFQKIFDENINRLGSDLEKNPELATALGTILIKFLSLSSLLKKKFSEMTPDDKIKAGNAIKEISGLLQEIMKKHE